VNRLVELKTGPNGSFQVNLSPEVKSNKSVPLKDDQETREITFHSTNRDCVGCGGLGKWRFATKQFICTDCSQHPPHKVVTRSTVMKTFGLTFEQLNAAWKDREIQMFTVKNFHSSTAPPIHLYYYHEVENLAKRLRH